MERYLEKFNHIKNAFKKIDSECFYLSACVRALAVFIREKDRVALGYRFKQLLRFFSTLRQTSRMHHKLI